MIRDNDGKQLSPCIVAKARYALGITTNEPANNKWCTQAYWNKVLEVVGSAHNVSDHKIVSASIQYNDIFSI